MNLVKRLSALLIRDGTLMRYAAVGVGMSLLDLSLFMAFSIWLGFHEVIANVASTTITVCVSYLVNRRFVFRGGPATWLSFFSFAGVTLFTGLLLQSVVIWGLVNWVPVVIPQAPLEMILPAAKISAMAVGAVCNYLAYKIVFRRS